MVQTNRVALFLGFIFGTPFRGLLLKQFLFWSLQARPFFFSGPTASRQKIFWSTWTRWLPKTCSKMTLKVRYVMYPPSNLSNLSFHLIYLFYLVYLLRVPQANLEHVQGPDLVDIHWYRCPNISGTPVMWRVCSPELALAEKRVCRC